ncbi:MAG TPA: hypothetical protein PLZ46_04415, partial [Bacteroidales bacterium]|nr:hypothetical protein [Bacteroidales bacterium]
THFKSPTYDSIIQSSIDHSDGIVIGHSDIKPSIMEYLKKYKGPIFKHPEGEDEYVEQYEEFYDLVMGNNSTL